MPVTGVYATAGIFTSIRAQIRWPTLTDWQYLVRIEGVGVSNLLSSAEFTGRFRTRDRPSHFRCGSKVQQSGAVPPHWWAAEYFSAARARSGRASRTGRIRCHASSRLAGMYSVGQYPSCGR